MHLRLAILFLVTLASTQALESLPLLRKTSSGKIGFTLLSAKETGVQFVAPFEADHSLNYLYHSGFACGSVVLGDMNLDGWPDIFLASGPSKNALYLQDAEQPLSFNDNATNLGVDGGNRWGTGSAMVDIDNDGDLDLYVCNYRGTHELYINQVVPTGKLSFIESAAKFGLDLVNASMTPAFADIDLDGDLDLFMLNNRVERPGGRPTKPPFRNVNGKPEVLPEFAPYYHLSKKGDGQGFSMDTYGQPDRLYRNDKGKFVDVTVKSGIAGIGHGLSATWWDYNLDNYPDLYVGNDFTDPDRLYRNNQDGTFTEVLGETMPYCSWSSMGSASADLNNDGLPDLFSADMAATSHFKQKVNMGDMTQHRVLMETGWPRQVMRNMLYVNTGIHQFKETAFMSGLAQSDWTWAVKLADFDNDGRSDVYLTNGMARNFSDSDIPVTPDMLVGRTEFEIYKDTPPMLEKNLAYHNQGGLLFEDVSSDWALDTLGMSYGAAHGDLDRDGDLDLVVMNLDAPLGIYRNDFPTGNRIVVQLVGSVSNWAGWGSRVELRAGGVTQTRFHHPTTGFQGGDLAELHFGLGDASQADSGTVHWPSGRRSELGMLEAGRRYIVTEPSDGAAEQVLRVSNPLFTERSQEVGLRYKHVETLFDDYAVQPLLPGKLSQLGPGMAWGDFDADGDDDVYIGGAAGKSGALFRLDEGKFVRVLGPWAQDSLAEDMGCVWFDADVDGDLDLFVASGGVEHALGSDAMADRLYVNRGKEGFIRDGDALASVGYSSSVVAAADVDRDGDVDLFVGSRSVPGKYPQMPRCRWLRNDGGRFAKMEGPENLGLVTGATWADMNDDGWQDLVVVAEWESPRIFISDGGRGFKDQSEAAGIAALKGWWNGVTSGDIDRDGDLDLVLTNVGLNTKYGQASAKKPSLLFYGDMDGMGTAQIIEAKPGDDGMLPIRGRSCSSRAMPFLAEKFTSYRGFASANLVGIYTPKRLDQAERFEATEFRTGILRNDSKDGTIRFRFEPLPFEAQATPNYGVTLVDANGDGALDITMVGNHYTREPETGLWRGTLGTTLLGDGKGGFNEVDLGESGFVVAGDGKSLAQTDLNADGRPDLVASQNNDRVLVFVGTSSTPAALSVRLQGKRGNLCAVGARVTLLFEDGSEARQDLASGSGYLSQSGPECFFGLGTKKPKQVKVRWPQGDETVHPVTSARLRVSQP